MEARLRERERSTSQQKLHNNQSCLSRHSMMPGRLPSIRMVSPLHPFSIAITTSYVASFETRTS